VGETVWVGWKRSQHRHLRRALSNSSNSKAGRMVQDHASRRQNALEACPSSKLGGFAWTSRANTVRAFSNRYQAQTSTQSVVRIAVARRVLSMSETARFAQTSSVRKPRGPLTWLFGCNSTERTPKDQRGATAYTLHGFASPFAFRRDSQESRLSGACGVLVHVKNPRTACTERLRTCMHERARDVYWPVAAPMLRVTA
jgi:hypothetical protein